MQSKFWFLVTQSLKKQMKTKAFLISNIILLVVLVGLINIDTVINAFGGDFDKESNIYVIDNTNENIKDSFIINYDALSKAYEVEEDDKEEIKVATKSVEDMQEELKDTKSVLIVFDTDLENIFKVSVITEKYMDMVQTQLLTQTINNTKYELALKNSDIDADELAKIYNPPVLERVILDETKNSEEENMNMIMETVFPTLILPLFMLIIFLVQMIGAEINEEKSTRSMEVIISNVPAKTHFFAKILAANVFIVSQALLVLLYGGLGFLLKMIVGSTGNMLGQVGSLIATIASTSMMSKFIEVIPFALILIILSFVAYSVFAGVLASMTVTMEDYQQMQMPIMFVCMAGYFLSMMAGAFEGSIFIKVLSYIPFVSGFLSPSLFVIGQIGIADVLISIVILGVFDYFMIKYGLRIYKIGILNYSTDKLWSRVFSAVKQR